MTPDPFNHWWVIYGEELYKALQRTAAGEEPGMVYLELFANTENEDDI